MKTDDTLRKSLKHQEKHEKIQVNSPTRSHFLARRQGDAEMTCKPSWCISGSPPIPRGPLVRQKVVEVIVMKL